jgi:hypothetical protein
MAGRKWTVETHPKRDQVIKALVAGTPQRTISDRFGIPKTSLQHYLAEHLAPQAAEAIVQRRLETGKDILDELDRIMGVMNRLYSAAEEYLQDPENPGKFYLGPRDWEVDVVVQDRREKKPILRRVRLDDLLDEALKKHPQLALVSAHYHHSDPRDTIVKVASVLTKQLELVGRILGEVKDVRINLTLAEAWSLVKTLIIRALKKHPAAMKDVLDELREALPGPG